MFGDECLRFASVHAFPIALLFHPQRGAVEEMTDFLQNRDGVRPVFGVLSDIDEPLEEFFRVGQIEISRDDQSSCHPVAFAEEGVARFDTVSSIGSIAEMSEEEFPGEACVRLEPFGIRRIGSGQFGGSCNFSGNGMENIFDWSC